MKILSTPDGPLSSGLAAREARGSWLGARGSGLARLGARGSGLAGLSVIHDSTLFSPAINSFPPSRLFNSLAIHSITLGLLPLLLKSLSLSTACLSSTLIHYNHFNPHLYGFQLPPLRQIQIAIIAQPNSTDRLDCEN